MKLATIALASVFALSSTFALATGYQSTSHHKYKSVIISTSQQVISTSRAISTDRPPGPTKVRWEWEGTEATRTTEAAWLAARTPVPTSPKSKRRVSAGLFCALFDRSSAAP